MGIFSGGQSDALETWIKSITTKDTSEQVAYAAAFIALLPAADQAALMPAVVEQIKNLKGPEKNYNPLRETSSEDDPPILVDFGDNNRGYRDC